ncbi:hypothetical protein FCM35_KLT14938 [Carex littledalei]|uniref:RNase H type-1 domain-containing protein n=1 Tax=Carex littledalei TaxID=544730 RepID=A0A833VDI2_9POAL|nr:hypothetical protein FCM35_KLT14938 [Carex littledalei]
MVINCMKYTCMSDGSWKERWQGGMGFLVKKKGQRSAYKAAGVVACSPIHAEARAMREAIRYIAEMNYYPCTFYTDSQKIATLSMQHQPPLMADWTVFKEIYEIWDIMKRNTYFHCVYLPREQIELAKKGRMEGPTWSNTGFTFPMFSD